MSTTPPGWYDDGSGTQRWWDGTAWTEHTQAAAAPAAPAAPAVAEAAPVAQQTADPYAAQSNTQAEYNWGAPASEQATAAAAEPAPAAAPATVSYVVKSASENAAELEATLNEQAAEGYRVVAVSGGNVVFEKA